MMHICGQIKTIGMVQNLANCVRQFAFWSTSRPPTFQENFEKIQPKTEFSCPMPVIPANIPKPDYAGMGNDLELLKLLVLTDQESKIDYICRKTVGYNKTFKVRNYLFKDKRKIRSIRQKSLT